MRLAALVSAIAFLVPRTAAPATKKPPDIVLLDEDCLATGSVLGFRTVKSSPDAKWLTSCSRRDATTFDCSVSLLKGDKFADGSSTSSITLRASSKSEPPRMVFLASPESPDVVYLDWSQHQYIWTATQFDMKTGYLLHRQCVGSVLTGEDLARFLKTASPK
jgi:hypothetical protein